MFLRALGWMGLGSMIRRADLGGVRRCCGLVRGGAYEKLKMVRKAGALESKNILVEGLGEKSGYGR